jgi:hypothetical protein
LHHPFLACPKRKGSTERRACRPASLEQTGLCNDNFDVRLATIRMSG